ncbi:hypothetical protein [Bradyrhizobium sp. PRIMUS42]|uniref:hypothetical protein n=1 Tax=Bradyrhizobium sp. PRIMUS42 TaxID=2908926 RepID=UPI001FF35295|nr:hypothetical protein [Bradyrhizobium sp. PRIMUS42]MCJ9731187.1 hypothetical protein [Bradyrhizobium sp. PRIMUS42]
MDGGEGWQPVRPSRYDQQMTNPKTKIRLALLTLATVSLQPLLGAPAQAQQAFSAACASDGGRATFVVSGENAQAGISRPNAVLKYADKDKGRDVYVTSDVLRPTILVVVAYLTPASPTAMTSRDTCA